MDTNRIIDKLNDILRHEWTGVAQYSQASFVITGLWREVYTSVFEESATESFGHAKIIGDKISALGGVPTVERNPVKQSQDVEEMLQHGLEFEQKAVALYNEAIQLAEEATDNRALVILLEDVLKEEQEGVDDLSRLLRDHQAHTGSQTTAKAKAG